jgi:hypothetical protein
LRLRGWLIRSLWLGCLLTGASSVQAATPVLEHIYPAGAQRGTTNIITAIGKQDPWPVEVWTDDARLQFKAEKDKGKFSVIVAPDAEPGPRLVRLYNAEGASTVRYFIVSATHEVEEKEPNDEFSKPQLLEKLPVIINGRLEKNGDVDSFAVNLEKDQWLIASLEAYVLASTMDGMLRITDTNGLQLAYNHDGNRTLDPFLTWQAPAKGTYVVQVMGFPHPANSSINFDGGTGNIYRLHLTTGPYLDYTYPTGVMRTSKAELKAYGWNLTESKGLMSLSLQTDSLAPTATSVPVRVPSSNLLRIPVGSLPEQQENEPNNATNEVQAITIPGHLSGRIQPAGDVDRFVFESKKGQKWEVAVQSDKLGFPLDATLRIEDSTGKELAKNDDENNSADPSLVWTAPADGKFTIVISSLLRQGGSNYIYRLSVTEPQPSFRATIAANNFNLSPGKTNEFKATVTRMHGHDGKLVFEASGLPNGVSLVAGEVPAKTGEVTLKLIAQADAKPFSGHFTISVKDTAANITLKAPNELISRGSDNGVPQGYTSLVIEQVDKLWLTVLK